MSFSDDIYHSVFYDTPRNTYGVDAKTYLNMPIDILAPQIVIYIEYESHHEITCANNKNTDQFLGLHNLISVCVCVDQCKDTNINIPQRPSYGVHVYISQLIRFARAFSHVTDFNNRNKFLTAKLLKQGYRYHKLRKEISKFYRRHFELIEKYHVSLKTLCNKVFVIQNFMEIWYINLRKSLENPNFSNLFKRIVNRFQRAGYSFDIMRQTACLVFNPIMA